MSKSSELTLAEQQFLKLKLDLKLKEVKQQEIHIAEIQISYADPIPLFYTRSSVQSFLNYLKAKCKRGELNQVESKRLLTEWGFEVEYFNSHAYRIHYYDSTFIL